MPLLETKQAPAALAIAQELSKEFAETAIERDQSGGTPKRERDRIRQSGLLNLVIPQEFGGWGESWITAFRISREFAKVDSSIAHVYSYHHLGVVIPHVFGTPEQRQHYYTQTVQHTWFWSNALNPLDRRTILTVEDGEFRLNGVKSFCSGSKDSDILPLTVTHHETGELLILAIPTQRQGITIHDDWNNIGQRQTDSGSVSFQNVVVYPNELFGSRSGNSQPFSTFRALLTQLNLANIYLGIAQGALEEAKKYTRIESRAWLTSGVESATQDPYILQHYGNLWIDLQSATALTDKAGELLQAAWEQQWNLTAEQRGECAISIAVAKVATTRVGLEVTNRIFEVMGARATNTRYGFDRFWRNLRTFTLHDPVDYKLHDIGNWVLNEEFPNPSFYA